MNAYTSGPWTYHSGMVWKADGSEDGIPIARMDRSTPSTEPTERDANARLIASAPELLEACQAALKVLDGTYEGDPTMFIRNVVVKATGGEEI